MLDDPKAELARIIDLVERMRRLQDHYFRTRERSTLIAAKDLERVVDFEIEKHKRGQNDLL